MQVQNINSTLVQSPNNSDNRITPKALGFIALGVITGIAIQNISRYLTSQRENSPRKPVDRDLNPSTSSANNPVVSVSSNKSPILNPSTQSDIDLNPSTPSANNAVVGVSSNKSPITIEQIFENYQDLTPEAQQKLIDKLALIAVESFPQHVVVFMNNTERYIPHVTKRIKEEFIQNLFEKTELNPSTLFDQILKNPKIDKDEFIIKLKKSVEKIIDKKITSLTHDKIISEKALNLENEQFRNAEEVVVIVQYPQGGRWNDTYPPPPRLIIDPKRRKPNITGIQLSNGERFLGAIFYEEEGYDKNINARVSDKLGMQVRPLLTLKPINLLDPSTMLIFRD